MNCRMIFTNNVSVSLRCVEKIPQHDLVRKALILYVGSSNVSFGKTDVNTFEIFDRTRL